MVNLLLNRKFNYCNILLTDGKSRENVGYRRPDGSHRYVRWLGFISRHDARELPGARSVRLVDISRIGVQGAIHIIWQDVNPDHYVHGCLTADGAYAVYDQEVVIVERRKKPETAS